MKIKELFKWENNKSMGTLIFMIAVALVLILFINRFDLTLIPNQYNDFGVKENVKYWQSGTLQSLRSFFEHFSFNFLIPILFVIVSLGFDKLFNKSMNWRFPFSIGALFSIIVTFIWEFQKRPVEWIEIAYDLLAVCLSYIFVRWMLKDYGEQLKQKPKKESVKK